MRRVPSTPLAVAAAAVLAACSRGPDEEGRRKLFARGEAGERAPAAAAPAAPAAERPIDALALDAGEVARRLGSFEWSGTVEWTVERQGEDARRVRAVERHRVRQSSGGEFEVHADVDPGLGPGSETGRDVVYAGGMTYARARHAPYRVRPTDRGRDAARFRDESFLLPRAVARLYGDALVVAPAGEAKVLGRAARRFALSLAKGATPAPATAAGAAAPDEDTRRRLAFLAGRTPQAASGELLVDAASGAPLRVRIAGAFGVSGDPGARATVTLLAQVNALGAQVGAVVAPKDALADERKAAGVAGALDAAGLRKRGEEEKPARAEPADEAGE